MMSKKEILDSAALTIQKEIDELIALKNRIDENFLNAIDLMMKTKGRVIITGIGKSGIIGQKISATLASTGTSSIFLHAAEAIHGDLGRIAPDDLVILISYSGETEEVLRLLPFLSENKNQTISITRSKDSTLAKNTDVFLSIEVKAEAGPSQIAPTTSTTVTLALGDALATTLMELKNFREENFAKFHPGGNLGRKLLAKVKDVMHTNNLPIVHPEANFIEVVEAITQAKLGCVFVLASNHEIKGIITDGDLRRAIGKFQDKVTSQNATTLMTANPVCIRDDLKIFEVEEIMLKRKISIIPVTDNQKLIGAIQLYDL